MIDSTAIGRIEQLSAAKAIRELDETLEGMVVPEGMTVLDLEKFNTVRRRFRGTFATKSVAAFVAYLEKFAGSGAPVFIDDDNAKAVCVVDIGDITSPDHCEHRASLSLRPTAAWTDILNTDGRPTSQREMVEFLSDWRSVLTPYGGADDINKAIAAVRKIDISATAELGSEVGNMSETRSTLAKVEARSVEGLPEGFKAKVRPYAELSEQDVTLELSVVTGDKPTLKLRMIAKGELLEAIAEEFADLLDDQLPDGMPSMIGKFEPGK